MIVVKVYLCPQGDEEEASLLGSARVVNYEPVAGQEGTFRYVASFTSNDKQDGLPPLMVEHVRSRGFWRLLSDVLNGSLVKREQNVLDRKPKTEA